MSIALTTHSIATAAATMLASGTPSRKRLAAIKVCTSDFALAEERMR